jgi:alpha,alpha-trehalose phosphorylase
LLTRPGVAAIEYEATLLDAPGGAAEVELVSTLDGRVENLAASDDPRVGSHVPPGALEVERAAVADGAGGVVVQRTRTTRLALAAAVRHTVEVVRGDVARDAASGAAGSTSSAAEPPEAATSSTASEDGVATTFTARLAVGDRIRLVKALGYTSSLEGAKPGLADEARGLVLDAARDGFDRLAEEQREVLDAFWARSDIEIDGDDALQQSIRFSLFSIFQSAGRDGRTGLSAKGLTGEGYEGHVFWDTEVFALPFFVYTQPAIARALLRFRVWRLPQARDRAAEMAERGALYPWRTINGEEASAYFPAGTAQYHINADIALALVRYVAVTGDRSLLLDGGAELLLETARMWASLGAFIPSRGGEFCINMVTGPDEYSALVNNNTYTNLMARAHLRHAARTADELARDEPEAWSRIVEAIGLGADEVASWRRAAEAMRVPHDPEVGIHLQDDAFLDRERWDFEGTPPENWPLLLHYHPLVIYRHQVLKQADVVLAQVLLAHDFTLAEKRRNFDFYDPLTTGDSSLSPSIQSVAAAELGYAPLAYEYFMRTARMDLDDVNGNTGHGVHIAAMAGTWVALVYGFAGLRDDDGAVSFAPRLPAQWRRLDFRLGLGDSRLRVSIRPEEVAYQVESGPAVEIRHFGQPVAVAPGEPAVFDLVPRLRAVVFDLDGVLTDTAELHYRAWQRMADEEGIPFDRERNERLRGIGRMESLELILEMAGQSMPPERKAVLAARKNSYFKELIASITPADLFPGVGDLLAELRAGEIGIAIASASHNAAEVVRRLGIGDRVDAIVDPSAIVKGKPDPEIFLAAAEQLGVRPEDCVGVEDARAGIEAIRAARMVAVGVGTDLPGAHWVVDDTRRLTLDAFARLFGGPDQR